jgi:glycosyltransferase involved in cell wall biosynthesis
VLEGLEAPLNETRPVRKDPPPAKTSKESIDLLVVTPARNEMRHIGGMIKSALAQSKKPAIWVIVDDGSTDGTGKVVQDALKDNPNSGIVLLYHDNPRPTIDKRYRPITAGIEYGLSECSKSGVTPTGLAIVDADVILEPNYFEAVCWAMESDERIGIGAGVMFDKQKDGFRPFVDPQGRYILTGAAVLYRFSFLSDIGGFPQSAAPDTVAYYRGLRRGWVPILTEKTHFFHLRTTSSWRRRIYDGGRFYKFGNPPLAAVLTAAYFTINGPNRVAGPAYVVGYTLAMIRRIRKLDEPLVREAFGNQRVISMITSYLLRRPQRSEVRMA